MSHLSVYRIRYRTLVERIKHFTPEYKLSVDETYAVVKRSKEATRSTKAIFASPMWYNHRFTVSKLSPHNLLVPDLLRAAKTSRNRTLKSFQKKKKKKEGTLYCIRSFFPCTAFIKT